jgi:hypothetical protein
MKMVMALGMAYCWTKKWENRHKTYNWESLKIIKLKVCVNFKIFKKNIKQKFKIKIHSEFI